MYRFVLPALAMTLLAACGGEEPRLELPQFDDPDLSQGKNTWMQVCRNCHLVGVAGAPAITDSNEWQERLEDGREALHQNAISGIRQGAGWSMTIGESDGQSILSVSGAGTGYIAFGACIPQ